MLDRLIHLFMQKTLVLSPALLRGTPEEAVVLELPTGVAQKLKTTHARQRC